MLNINIAKAETSIEIDFEALPEVSREFVINYGLTQVLNDSVAAYAVIDGKVCINKKPLDNTDVDQFEAIIMGRVQKKLDALIEGSVRIAGVKVGNPIRADAIDLAIDMTVRDQFRLAGKPLDAKAMRQAAIELVGRNPAYTHLAQKRADEAKAFFADAKALAALQAKGEAETKAA